MDKLGRVLGAIYSPIFIAETLASLVDGWLASMVSASGVFVLAGCGLLAVTLLGWSRLRAAGAT